MQNSTSTIIVGQRALLREGLASLLHSTEYTVARSVSRAGELDEASTGQGGRILVILAIGGTSADYEEMADNIDLLRSRLSNVKIVVVAETAGTIDLQRIMALAPDGYILNLGSREILVKSLELALLDQKIFVLGEPVARQISPDTERRHGTNGSSSHSEPPSTNPKVETHASALSQRELDVLACLSRGDSNKNIARSCNITEATVKVHLKAILRKTEAQNRTQAAIWALANGLVNGAACDYARLGITDDAVRAPGLESKFLSAQELTGA
jgi:two-component system, NarL family, nitrate/nitrite response regulator NarL